MLELELGSATTAELSPDDKPAYWREQVRTNQGGARVDFGRWPDFDGGLRVMRLQNYRLGDFQNVDFQSSAISYERTLAEVEADGDRSARLLIPRDGALGIEQHDTRVWIRPGQMGVIDWAQRMVLSHADHARAWIINIPADYLHLSPDGPPHLALDARDPLLGSVLALADQLSRHSETLTATQFLTISTHMASLLAGALDERWAPQNSRLASIARDARRHIQRCSDDPRLTVLGVAEQLGVTRRQLERAMRLSGTTPHGFLLSTRLDQAVKRLSDPRNCRRTIADIAYESGFSALSAFNRAYREKYGVPAGQLRRPGPS
ncbi:AraC family transcriptional regulator [Nocardia sp. CDC153]|uniref:helix-turn-helix transcriptional regulator n=1 Tax=Nocardia sp. CDC153 TaxID=3112167 RepID=UPI002DBC2E43|nr:AraC family transcriptional regulator [Nocardia sp. CDC153]MEC3953104.1 AraC family transcriptional regulator [Nocardia sp. CDC153]